jgi:PAS domain S-box-containing protein
MSHQGQLSVPGGGGHDIDQVLLGLADGSYVLSTPDGAVAECGVGVVALLGTPAKQLAGHPTAAALVAGADPATHAAFEQVLHGKGGGARVFCVTTAAGAQRPLQFVVVAVPLALGWEFTSLLGELGSRDTGTWHADALRLRHGRALEAIEGACRNGAQPDPGGRLAGILVVVRDVEAPPLTRADVGRRMDQHRAAARAAAAAAVAEAARRCAEATRNAPAYADAHDGAGGGLEDLVERAHILRERVEEAEREAAAAIADRDLALERLAAVQAEHAAETERRHAGQTELPGIVEQLREARGESALLRGRVDALGGELEAARTQLRGGAGELERVRAQLDAVRGELSSTRQELAGTPAVADGARAEHQPERLRADQLRSEAQTARAAADTIRAEFAFDELRTAPPAASAATAAANEVPVAASGEAVALIGLDGSFKHLDEAFCSLLGCGEEDLRAARWPSVIDRENIAAHQEIARALRAGEIDSAPVETIYMHAQGLLVPIAGVVSMHSPAAGGEATHYVFRADVSRTSGP